MTGSQLRNLRMFGELCGDVAMNQVILVSNMWQKVKPEVGAAREGELKTTFWKPLIDKGSRIERLKNADPSEAWRIVEQLIKAGGERQAVLLQEELVELQKKLNETEAGKMAYSALQKVLDSQKEVIKSLLAQLGESNEPDPSLVRELKKEQQRVQQEFQKTFEQAKKQKIPLGRRIMAFFFGRKSRAKVTRVVGS
ncbi:hypothetical protein P691DRAFT_809235 [Macrolepiota fuliginosa MF-IS2]|uniref:Uncharacterized protein n=1 Tax=Macrolepiota fuliginosa MF-IS2 TaxID=1400762 RepID=A0A9P5XGB7_9AGAR|nr:hypothetical protein P691DRAFT_809235 [Macrolepiota fuliginosa MF-IS2]